MAIKKTTRRVTPSARRVTASRMPARRVGYSAPRSINAGTSITASARARMPRSSMGIKASKVQLTPEQKIFAKQLISNTRRMSVMGATNTNNIMARPEFLELLPLFVQKLLVLDVFGSVAMKSRQQMIPYFKVIAENDKGETKAGDILNSPFVNRQGLDPNFAGRVVKNETVAVTSGVGGTFAYTPILPGSVTIVIGNNKYVDNGAGGFQDAAGDPVANIAINYATGAISGSAVSGDVVATYEYDNETVGPDAEGNYGAKMGKIYLMNDEINMIAEAHELACYWSIYSAFAAQTEWGSNIGDMAKEAAFSEMTAEINTDCFRQLYDAATYKPQFNWDAAPVLSGAVVPSDYLNMFKLKLGQAAASIYQQTRLSRPNRLIVGTTAAEYIGMIDGFVADSIEDTVGPYKFGKLDQFDIIVDPNYDPNTWVMCCKSNDIRRNSALYGEYMPMVNTDAIGLANASVQQGVATMYGTKIVNPATIVSGKILGTF